MKKLLEGLEKYGLTEVIENVDIYTSDEKGKKKDEAKKILVKKKESDYLYDKEMRCPVCLKNFKTKIVKTGNVRVLSKDSDLRPHYDNLDAVKYGVISCTNCGYSALSKSFPTVTSTQSKMLKEAICSHYVNKDIDNNKVIDNTEDDDIYNYDYAIERHKLALLCSTIKKSSNKEIAMICLKLSWLIREKVNILSMECDKHEEELKGSTDNEQLKSEINKKLVKIRDEIEELKEEEMEAVEHTYFKLKRAYETEYFNDETLNEGVCQYLMAEMARKLGNYEEAKKILSLLITNRNTERRIKNQAIDLKDIINKEIKEKNEVAHLIKNK